jgi:hypothetical protein
MAILIIEEYVRLESGQNACLVYTTHEKGFVNMNAPSTKSVQDS